LQLQGSLFAILREEVLVEPRSKTQAHDDITGAIRAWTRLDGALASYRNAVRRDTGLTPLQLAILQLAYEAGMVPLRDLRRILAAHPATLGQAVAALSELGMCSVARSPADRRVRLVALTRRGRAALDRVPFAGPLRLGRQAVTTHKLKNLRRALDDAVELFGLVPWATPAARSRSGPASEKRLKAG
jgi:DNA-binding MarR family transcriptional regulator